MPRFFRRLLSSSAALACCAWAAVESPPGQGGGGAVNAGTDSAVELRAPTEREGFSFVVFGDRTGGPPEGVAVLEEGVRMANRLDPDFVMTVGDMIQGYNDAPQWLKEMREYRGVMEGLGAPWYPVLGNHDVYARGRPPGGHKELYKRHFGPLYYSFDYRWAHIVCLSSDEAQSFSRPAVNQNMSAEQLDWLRADLAATEAEQVFVFLHHPRWTGAYEGCNWPRVHEVLVADGRCTAVFAGHTHRWVDYGERDGIRYLVLGRTGGAASSLLETSSMHVVTHVRARRDGITLGVMQTGSLHGGGMVSAEELSEMGGLARGGWLRASGELAPFTPPVSSVSLEITNPTTREVAWELLRPGASRVWRVSGPEGEGGAPHGKLGAGEAARVELALRPLADYPDPPPADHPGLLAGTRAASEAEVRLTYALESGLTQVFRALRRLPAALPRLAGESGPAPEGAGRALDLDGTSALRVDVGERLEHFTLECWARGVPTGARAGLLCNTEQSGFGIFWGGPNGPDGRADLPRGIAFVERLAGGGRGYAVATAARPPVPDEWTHLALCLDGEHLRFFVDGALTGEERASGLVSNDLPLMIGADTDGRGAAVDFFRGTLDEVRLSRRARYRAPFTPRRVLERDEDTVLLLHLDRRAKGFYPDDSGAARHARPVGSPRLRAAAR